MADLLARISTPLILASGSKYRMQLLARLRIYFIAVAPEADETPQTGEKPGPLSGRLAEAKARALAPRFPDHWILGCDQVAAADGHIFGKPGTAEGATEQLRALAGKTVQFITAMALIRNDRVLRAADITTVRFRALGDDEIRRYVEAEPSFDCAGSFKSEGLGIALSEEIVSRDPTALIGLPLIGLSKLLREAGFALP